MNPSQENPENKLIHVLVIEDNPGDSRLIREMFLEAEDKNFRLEISEKLSVAAEKIDRQNFDVGLLDLSLPDSHGLETFGRIAAKAPRLPIIILTGLNDETVALDAVRGGAQDYLVKGSFDGYLLTRAIRYAIERKKLLLMRDKFVSMVSHELRNPLAVLQGSIGQLSEDLSKSIDAEQKELLEMAGRAIDRLLRTTNDLLDLAKMEAGKLILQEAPFDVVSLAREIGATFSGQMKSKGLRYIENVPDQPVKILADRDKIAEVFTNLVTNAIKFTSSGSIEIEVREGPAFVGCSVADTGPGIAAENLPRVFSKFEQFGRKTAGAAKGTGLGLAICKEIIEYHNGRIWVESKPGQGARFIFTLPK